MMTDYNQQILDAMAGSGGFTTGDIAQRVKPMFGNKRMHSAFIRTRLVAMQKAGLVKPMDDLKPVAWIRQSTTR